MTAYNIDYLGKGDLTTDVPHHHLKSIYEAVKDQDGKVHDRHFLVEIDEKLLRSRNLEPEELQMMRRTVQNINAKQVCRHTYHWRTQRDRWALATAFECGLYALLFFRMR
jgi:hypothetical protein